MSTIDPNAAARPDSGLFGLDTPAEQAGVILLPVPFDATTSYHRGAALGPTAILQASRQVELYDHETGHPYRAGIHLLPPPDGIDLWNEEARAAAEPILARGGEIGEDAALRARLARVNELGERVAEVVERTAEHWLDAGRLFGVVGGDHSVPLGAICACARRHPGLGILHIDAHADLRRAYQGFVHSHASIMANVLERAPQLGRLVQVAVRDLCPEELERIQHSNGRVVLFHDAELWRARHSGEPFVRICERIVAELPAEVYISFDIDGLDPALCPHTGTPVPGGLGFAEACALLSALSGSGRRVVGFDLCEVAPGPDPHDEWDGNVGARILYKLIGHALRSRFSPSGASSC
ncbi:MAG: agmatinase family protein [Myxococcales bacterium]|nr:agmatinase family protein [Myxococcota bacterium]MDW8283452.1 agmatinase family protein [Myxococcales bacterium]